ncbi:uncharacterized protein BP5553_06824 [Neofusicoccum parvum]|nr:uncharacterized protein BP5553_06824 [Neofusicoccum parvum]
MYKKSDNSNYTYHGRSYGVGSSIGLNDSFLTPNLHIANYTFFETGYLTRFKCIHNTSTEWALEISGTPWTQSLPQVYNVSTSSTLLTTEEGRTRSQTAFVAYKPADVLHLAAGSSYALLNATQCTATTTATNFSIAADVSARLITVSPVAQAAAPDPEPSGLVARWAAETLVPLTWIGSTSFTSVPGDMLYRNVFNVRQQPTAEADADRVLRAVEESLNALFDLAMVAQASAQLMIARDAAPRPVEAVVRVLRVGQAAYVYAVLAVHVVVVALLAGEAARTGLWWQLPRLDFADVKSGIVASSAEVAERVRWEHGKFGGAWTGAPEDRVAGQVKVMLARSKAGLLCMRPA